MVGTQQAPTPTAGKGSTGSGLQSGTLISYGWPEMAGRAPLKDLRWRVMPGLLGQEILQSGPQEMDCLPREKGGERAAPPLGIPGGGPWGMSSSVQWLPHPTQGSWAPWL